MTDQSKQWIITEQGMKEAAEKIMSDSNAFELDNTEHFAEIIAAHSEAASSPEPTPKEETEIVVDKMFRERMQTIPRGLTTPKTLRGDVWREIAILLYRKLAAAPPQGTPAPEPDKCPTCRSGLKGMRGEMLDFDGVHYFQCRDPWHSTVEAQKEKP